MGGHVGTLLTLLMSNLMSVWPWIEDGRSIVTSLFMGNITLVCCGSMQHKPLLACSGNTGQLQLCCHGVARLLLLFCKSPVMADLSTPNAGRGSKKNEIM